MNVAHARLGLGADGSGQMGMATLTHSQNSQIEKIIIYVPAQLYVAPEATKSKPDYRHQDNVQKQNIYSSTELKQDDHKKKMPPEESKHSSSRDLSSSLNEKMPSRSDAATPQTPSAS